MSFYSNFRGSRAVVESKNAAWGLIFTLLFCKAIVATAMLLGVEFTTHHFKGMLYLELAVTALYLMIFVLFMFGSARQSVKINVL